MAITILPTLELGQNSEAPRFALASARSLAALAEMKAPAYYPDRSRGESAGCGSAVPGRWTNARTPFRMLAAANQLVLTPVL